MKQESSEICPACSATVGRADNFCEKCGQELAVVAECRTGRDHVELDLGTLAGMTDRGRRHFRNEDAMDLALIETPAGAAALAVVCDGVSTSVRPDEASLAAARAALRVLSGELKGGTTPVEALPTALAAADAAVCGLSGQSANAPATTIVSGVVTADEVAVAWIGDSRAYWLPDDHSLGCQLLTRDDSLAAELILAGTLSEADAITSPDAHILTGWLGADAEAREPHVATFQPPGPGLLLLCTDGLWNYQPEAAGLARLARPKSASNLAAATEDLLAFALEAGGHDNVTIVLIAFPPHGNGAAPRSRRIPTNEPA